MRPFVSLDECLSYVGFRLSRDQDFSEATLFEPLDVHDLQPEFSLRIDHAALTRADGLGPSDFALVIRLADARLHRSEIVQQWDIAEVPTAYELPRNIFRHFSWKTGVDATVAVVLKDDREPQVGRPFLRGHWVARKDFSIRSKIPARSFPIERWTAAEFVKQGLPADTAYWIDFICDDLNQRFEDPGHALRVCLGADVYDALAVAETTEQARGVMSLILVDILSEILFRGLSAMDSADEIERGGLLDTVLRKVLRATGTEFETLRKAASDGNYSRLRTFVQATMETRRSIAKIATRR